MKYLMRTAFYSVLATLVISPAYSCELIMGYRTNEKPPLIGKAPDNNGLYFELFKTAADRIGCSLTVERKPKKRIMNMIVSGKIDFYPGLKFTKKRAENFGYINNGLTSSYALLTRVDSPDFKNREDILEAKPTEILPYGSPDLLKLEIPKKSPKEATTLDVMKLISNGSADIYFYSKDSLLYALKQNPMPNLRVQECCSNVEPMYLGFSLNSKNYNKIPNKNYDANQPISATNSPVTFSPDSIAKKLSDALADMKKEGVTSKIYKKYY
ncbi:substrate-binding periplasmic protein [Vibrio marisflavi]|uniref:Solute-binding protein family 3/N-terminal domain-containing protein n=1 Tax=Vibrio marisflavi CECT 7928 TaxID=634439 RepID=A0ABM9A096_9VIBR|nr:transporter substrate-binding domain-containing protein [Vibrio marisflavi]CAH0536826.1 hypothetical protein VMF7928_00716 [Vibrio marisflavi CECT 7928]